MSSRGGSGRRCEALKADGERCRAWAVRSSDPPRCASHSGLTGVPAGNRNAERHGAYSQPLDEIRNITDAVEDMQKRISLISRYLDTEEDLKVEQMMSALNLYGVMVSRYGRLLRDQRALSDEAIDSFLSLVARAIDEVKTQMGYPVELGSSDEG